MTKLNLLCSTATALVILAVTLPGSATAQAGLAKCTIADAKAAIAQGQSTSLCGCEAVTRGMVNYVQRRPDFLDLLTEYESSCVGLATVLGDMPTAAFNRSGGRMGADVDGEGVRERSFTPRSPITYDQPTATVMDYDDDTDDDDDHDDDHGDDHGDDGDHGKGKGGGKDGDHGKGKGGGKDGDHGKTIGGGKVGGMGDGNKNGNCEGKGKEGKGKSDVGSDHGDGKDGHEGSDPSKKKAPGDDSHDGGTSSGHDGDEHDH